MSEAHDHDEIRAPVLVEFAADWTISEARQMDYPEIASVRDNYYTRPRDVRSYHRFYRKR